MENIIHQIWLLKERVFPEDQGHAGPWVTLVRRYCALFFPLQQSGYPGVCP